jgi:ribonuclease P protein component
MNERQILSLLKTGQVVFRYPLKVHFQEGAGDFGVSVPKRNFKRAVRRNLLKRRIRESYRRQKALLGSGVDVLFVYTSREVLPYEAVYADMTAALTAIAHASNA